MNGRRIFQAFDVVLVRTVPYVQLRFEGIATRFARLPVTGVPFVVMKGAERVARVTVEAAIAERAFAAVGFIVRARPVAERAAA